MRKNYNINTSHQFVILLVKLFASLCITINKNTFILYRNLRVTLISHYLYGRVQKRKKIHSLFGDTFIETLPFHKD